MTKKLLLIDDDEDEQDFFAEAINIAQLSVNCIYANNAEQGIKLLDNFLPDFIFLDNEDITHTTIKLGAVSCIKKAFSINTLANILKSIIVPNCNTVY